MFFSHCPHLTSSRSGVAARTTGVETSRSRKAERRGPIWSAWWSHGAWPPSTMCSSASTIASAISPADSRSSHGVVVGEHQQCWCLDLRQLIGGERHFGATPPNSDQSVQHGEEGVLEVRQALGGQDELGDLGRQRVLVDHLGQLLDLALRRRLELHQQPAERSDRQEPHRQRRRCVEHDRRTTDVSEGQDPVGSVDGQPTGPQRTQRVGDDDGPVETQSVKDLDEESDGIGSSDHR